ncbi:MAG: transporter, partial [Nitrospinota bacterium]
GLVFAARLNSLGPDIGPLFPLDAVAVTVIGGTSFVGGEGGVSGTLLGALFIALLQNGIQLLGFAAPWQLVVQGAVVILAILLNRGIRIYGTRLARSGPGG